MKKLGQIVSVGLLVLLVVVGVVFWQALRFMDTPASTDDTMVVFEVKQGETLRDVAGRLETLNLVTDARKFRAFARFRALSAKVRSGEYALKRSMAPTEILKILASGRSIEYVVTVSEGLNRFEIASVVDRAGVGNREEFLRATQDREFIKEVLGESIPTLEGYLFPETYYVTRVSGVRGLIRQMVNKFKEKLPLIQSDGENAVRLEKHELVTLASIVEKETGAQEERPVISSVFHNRLRKKMKLQTDPTVIYGIWVKTGQWDRNISRQDLATPTPYNTYVIEGLPPGPIANPGFLALQAAAKPAKTEFLFFVSRNDGTHVFSREYGQHKNAVNEYQVQKKSREGKSWRDLKSRKDTPNQVVEAKKNAPMPKKKPN